MTSLEIITAKHETMLDQHSKILDKHNTHLLRIEQKLDKIYLAIVGLLVGIIINIARDLVGII